jgi:hypothetical protein
VKLPGVLGQLNDEQHGDLISWLSQGKTDVEIATAIIDNGWVSAEVKKPTLIKNVNRWRRGQGQKAMLKNLADHFQTPTKMKRQIDVLEELTQLVLKQKERLKKLASKEDPTPLLMDSVSSEMKTLLIMLEKLGKIQLDTGLLRRVKVGEVEGDYIDFEDVDESQEEAIFSEEDRRLLMIVDAATKAATVQ